MALEKADILTFVNGVLRRSETDIDVQIQAVLDDLSDAEFLEETDESQSLENGDLTLDYPTGFITVVSISLTDSNGVEWAPLEKLPGGHAQYRKFRNNDSAAGRPEWYSEFDDKFWLWRPANGEYDAVIEYTKRHPALSGDTGSIEFGDEFKNALNCGAAFQVALKFKLKDYISIWGPMYETAKEKMRLSRPGQPYIVKG